MSDFGLLTVSLLASVAYPARAKVPAPPPAPTPLPPAVDAAERTQPAVQRIEAIAPPEMPVHRPTRSPATQPIPGASDVITPAATQPQVPRPASGSQLYQQRLTALRAGRTYTRLPVSSFRENWMNATQQPTYEQWVSLLAQEAQSMAGGQGNNRLTVIVGDSLSLWLPPEQLASDRFWLNQGISGDTTTGVLRRLPAFAQTRPDTIHLMVGINDLRQGATNAEVLTNLRQIMRQLRQTHPQARIFVHSILPTRFAAIPSDRIRYLNRNLASITQQERVSFLNLQAYFEDDQGNLRRDLTTDGLHLSLQGYALWHWAIRATDWA